MFLTPKQGFYTSKSNLLGHFNFQGNGPPSIFPSVRINDKSKGNQHNALLGRQEEMQKIKEKKHACWQVILRRNQDGLMETKENYQAMSQSRRPWLGTRCKKTASMRLVWGLVVGRAPAYSHDMGSQASGA